MSHDIKVFHRLQIAHSALFRAADHRTRSELELTITQLAVLFVLSDRDGQSIGEISKTLAMGKSSLTGLVDRMVEKGFVRRVESPSDGRMTHIFLQASGRGMLERSADKTRDFNQALLAPFSLDERAVISRFLTHVTDNASDIINGRTVQQESDDHG